ncbi:MAG: WD40 repeat domain-containing protein, partial [Candidatus Saccharimonadales bacterium]
LGPPRSIDPVAGYMAGDRAMVSDDCRWLAIAQKESGVVRLLQPDHENTDPNVINGLMNVAYLALSADGRYLAAGPHNGGPLAIAELRAPGKTRLLDAGFAVVPAFSPDGRWLLAGVSDQVRHLGHYRVYEVGAWSLRHELACDERAGGGWPAAAFSPDSRLAAIVPAMGKVRLVDTRDWSELATLEPPDLQIITRLAFSADGGWLAVACESNRVQLWDLRSVRRQLRGMKLDWDLPPYPAAPTSDDEAAETEVLLGELAKAVAP